MNTPVVLSYGLGTDSTAILLRWINDPSSRDFELSDLIVVTAMTGDEWPESGELVEDHILPLLREHGIRYIQVARATGSQRDDIVVLDDSRNPQRLHLAGAYKLSDELLAAGTVPQMGGIRKCSQKAKGWPLDTIIDRTLGPGTAYRHVVGFEAEEPKRAGKDVLAGNSPYRTGEYPLIEWGWNRAQCEWYILHHTGVAWLKSACIFCPFALGTKAGIERVLPQYRANIKAAVDAMFIEHVSVALNPLQGLAKNVRLVDLITADGNDEALRALNERLDSTPHRIYQVRRVHRGRKNDPSKRANGDRSVLRMTETGSRQAMISRLITEYGTGHTVESDGWFHRVIVTPRQDVFPCIEHLFVVAPAVVEDKQKANFEAVYLDAELEAMSRLVSA